MKSQTVTWGSIKLGDTRVPLRLIVFLVGSSFWLSVTILRTGPPGIAAFAFNISVVIVAALGSIFTRTIPLRTVCAMLLFGGLMVLPAFYLERLPMLGSPYVAPFLEEFLKALPFLIFLLRARRFTLYTLGMTDLLLMGLAVGAGFGFVEDACMHVQSGWHTQVAWLPTAEIINGHTVAGHAVWTCFVAAVVAGVLSISPSATGILLYSIVAVSLAGLDHAVANYAITQGDWLASSVNTLTIGGWLMIIVTVGLVAVSFLYDGFALAARLPRVAAVKLPGKGQFSSGVLGIWDFILDCRRLAYVNARFRASKGQLRERLQMVIDVLIASLESYHQAPAPLPLEEQTVLSRAAEMAIGSGDEPELPLRYDLLDRVNEGGMGMIYRANDKETGRVLAIKVLHPDAARNEANLQRFRQEAKAIQALNHPHLVSLVAFGVTPKSAPYLAMEFIEGITLQKVFRTTGLTPARFFDIFDQVCQGLGHAHQVGVIHRDIKPGNILLSQTADGRDFVKIVDFGVAKVISPEITQDITQSGQVVGSPVYMSPEQGLGRLLDARSDIYSLGCVLYEALMSQPPFRGVNAVETIFMHVNKPPLPFAAVRQDLTVPPELEALVMRTLEKNPQRRYAHMVELREALQSVRELFFQHRG